MSTTPPKKEKSKSKDKNADKPPKDTKSKKPKQAKAGAGEAKSKDGVSEKSKSKKSKLNSELENDSQIVAMSFLKGPSLLQQPPAVDDSQALTEQPKNKQTIYLFHRICTYHKDKNIMFCESCQQTACQNCTLYGPHNSQLHRISRLQDVYKSRYVYLNQIVCGGFINKRDRLTDQIKQLEVVSDELKFNKMNIQKATKIQFSETLDRLKGSCGGKLAILHHEMAMLQADLEGINSLGTQFFQLTNTNPDTFASQTNPKSMVPFLLRSKQLQQDAEQLIAKPIKTSIDVYPYDLPREIAERKVLIQSNQNNNKLIEFKNEIIWKLVQHRKVQSEQIMEQFYEEANQECQEWTLLTNKLKAELAVFDMGCEHCGKVLSGETVNADCSPGNPHTFVSRHA